MVHLRIFSALFGDSLMKIEDKKEYIKPKIVFEADLEVKAGSPIGKIPPDPGSSDDPITLP
jgi:hypothetical protein